MKKIICPHCGSDVDEADRNGRTYFFCPYCGANLLTDRATKVNKQDKLTGPEIVGITLFVEFFIIVIIGLFVLMFITL